MKQKQILVIGSCVCDIILNVTHLPTRTEDISIHHQTMQLGGCAFNVASILDAANTNYQLYSPIGSGIYADFIVRELAKRNIKTMIPRQQEENGCCYCFVEEDGERTFISYHGIEYQFQAEWFSKIDKTQLDAIYICGLELEEDQHQILFHWLKTTAQTTTIYFALGPRIHNIPKEVTAGLFALHPIVHLNKQEAFQYTNTNTLLAAAKQFYQETLQDVIITLGSEGCYLFDGHNEYYIHGYHAKVQDTIGAGDSHIATYIAMRHKQYSKYQSLKMANFVASDVVTMSGANLHQEIKDILKKA